MFYLEAKDDSWEELGMNDLKIVVSCYRTDVEKIQKADRFSITV
jgi:hypothetical protein